MRYFLEEIKDFRKKGDIFLLILCLIVAGFGLVCIASATSAEKFGSNIRYITLQSVAILMGVAAYVVISSMDLEILSEHRAALVAFNCCLLLLLIPFGDDNNSGNRSWLDIPGLPFMVQPAEICRSPILLSWRRSCPPTRTGSPTRYLSSIWACICCCWWA